MQELDYKKIGLKCGLEIHQQLDTRKLFCNCPSVLRKDAPDFEVKRKLHVVAGESGNVDVAARHEVKKDKEFIYQGYDSTCLVELDEEPPYEINQEALKIVLHIAILLNCDIIPLTQIMRKTVIDGSNTSGFQRTVLIARNGFIKTSEGNVGIESVCLEEDAARIIEKKDNSIIYRLDRLGIPLVEIATAPEIKTPKQAKEVALQLGNLLRSCNVKRGIGTIRQDINISILGHPRVEIKGFQDIKVFSKVIEKEIKRQLNEIKKKNVKSSVRDVLSDFSTKFLRPMPSAARMYPETDLPLLKISRKIINDAKKTLPKLRSDMMKDLEKIGLNQEMIKLLFKQNKIREFKELLEIVDNGFLIAKVLLIFPKNIAKHKKMNILEVEKILNSDVLGIVLDAFKKKEISEKQIKQVLEKIVSGIKLKNALKFDEYDMSVIEEKIMKLIKDKPGLSIKAYMGLVMKEFGGKIDGKDAIKIIMKYCKPVN